MNESTALLNNKPEMCTYKSVSPVSVQTNVLNVCFLWYLTLHQAYEMYHITLHPRDSSRIKNQCKDELKNGEF